MRRFAPFRFRRLVLRGVPFALIGAIVVAALCTPGIVHTHRGGEAPHSHARDGSHTADDAAHAHSHPHRHTYSHGHSHAHGHSHSHSHRWKAKGVDRSNGCPAHDTPHLHVSLLGFEFTITLPPKKRAAATVPVRVPQSNPRSKAAADDDRVLTIATAAPTDSESGFDWLSWIKPGPLPGRASLLGDRGDGVVRSLRDSPSLDIAFPPPIPPPRD